jgi:hypothetical protein
VREAARGHYSGGCELWRDVIVGEWSSVWVQVSACPNPSSPCWRRIRCGSHALQRAEQIWHAAAPGCQPLRAAYLTEPVAALQAALAWQSFLDSIEPNERAYHQGDPAAGLIRAGRLADARPGE